MERSQAAGPGLGVGGGGVRPPAVSCTPYRPGLAGEAWREPSCCQVALDTQGSISSHSNGQLTGVRNCDSVYGHATPNTPDPV